MDEMEDDESHEDSPREEVDFETTEEEVGSRIPYRCLRTPSDYINSWFNRFIVRLSRLYKYTHFTLKRSFHFLSIFFSSTTL